MKKYTKKEDKLLFDYQSPLAKEMSGEEEKGVMVTGNLGIGNKGHPVTILIEDEVTGEVLEVNHVESAFVVLEDRRKNSSGWLAMAVGEVKKLSQILGFLAGATLDGLRKMVGKD